MVRNMRSSIEKFPEMIYILKRGEASPNKLASQLHSDRRTVEKLLDAATEMNIVGCKSMKIEGRNYRACGLTPNFKKFLEEVER